jgi:hypothetical protein
MRKGRGREGAAIAYHIPVTVLLLLRASAILSAPISPISVQTKLSERSNNGDR